MKTQTTAANVNAVADKVGSSAYATEPTTTHMTSEEMMANHFGAADERLPVVRVPH